MRATESVRASGREGEAGPSPDLPNSRSPGLSTSRSDDFPSSRPPDLPTSRSPGLSTSRSPDLPLSRSFDLPLSRLQTVATGVTGEPATPGMRSGGAVSRKRLRRASRNHAASSVRYHNSPKCIPNLTRQCSCSGSPGPRCGRRGSTPSVDDLSTARLSQAIAASPLSAIHSSSRLS